MKPGLAKGVLRSYRRMILSEGREKGRYEVFLILMSGCFDRASDKRAVLLLGREGEKTLFSGEVGMKGLVLFL